MFIAPGFIPGLKARYYPSISAQRASPRAYRVGGELTQINPSGEKTKPFQNQNKPKNGGRGLRLYATLCAKEGEIAKRTQFQSKHPVFHTITTRKFLFLPKANLMM
jgi:hypothetical protein